MTHSDSCYPFDRPQLIGNCKWVVPRCRYEFWVISSALNGVLKCRECDSAAHTMWEIHCNTVHSSQRIGQKVLTASLDIQDVGLRFTGRTR